MGTELEHLNSFDNFIQAEELSVFERIRRDLYIFLKQRVGSQLFGRDSGSLLAQLENEANYSIMDTLVKTQIVEAVARYNLQTTPELQAICSADMVAIKRSGELVEVLVLFIPMQFIAPQNIQSLILSMNV